MAKEIKMDKREDLFAATPLLEALRIMVSHASTLQKGHFLNEVLQFSYGFENVSVFTLLHVTSPSTIMSLM